MYINCDVSSAEGGIRIGSLVYFIPILESPNVSADRVSHPEFSASDAGSDVISKPTAELAPPLGAGGAAAQAVDCSGQLTDLTKQSYQGTYYVPWYLPRYLGRHVYLHPHRPRRLPNIASRRGGCLERKKRQMV